VIGDLQNFMKKTQKNLFGATELCLTTLFLSNDFSTRGHNLRTYNHSVLDADHATMKCNSTLIQFSNRSLLLV